MPGKLKADNGAVRVPKRDSVQEMAEAYGYQRVLDEDGNPMLIKQGSGQSVDLQSDVKRKAKVIGPAKVAAARG